jgi:hypothetical protein
LVKRFARPSLGALDDGMGWDNHRWIRLRTLLSATQAYLADLRVAYGGGQPGDVSYDEMLLKSESRTSGPYKWRTVATKRSARRITAAMSRYASRLEKAKIDFSNGAPQPEPRLVKRPHF